MPLVIIQSIFFKWLQRNQWFSQQFSILNANQGLKKPLSHRRGTGAQASRLQVGIRAAQPLRFSDGGSETFPLPLIFSPTTHPSCLVGTLIGRRRLFANSKWSGCAALSSDRQARRLRSSLVPLVFSTLDSHCQFSILNSQFSIKKTLNPEP